MSSYRLNQRFFAAFSAVALIFLPTTGPVARAADPAPARKAATPNAAVQVNLADESTLKVALRDEQIELETRYGKLVIPAADLTRVEFRTRIPPGDARRAEAAVGGLGSKEFRERETATAELLRLGVRAIPALTRASGDGDAEVARRAKDILEKLRESVPADQLVIREDDKVWAGGCELVGHIAAESLRVETLPFGEQRLKLSDVRSLRSPSATEAVADAPADPGSPAAYANEVGKTYSFKVTGRPEPGPGAMVGGPVMRRVGPGGGVMVFGAGGFGDVVWGTDVYTIDSTLASVVVHAGLLKPGQTGVVKVKILGPQAGFKGSTRNGVTTMDFGPFPGYSVSR